MMMKVLVLTIFAFVVIQQVNATKTKQEKWKELFDKMKAAKDSNEKPKFHNTNLMKINKKGGKMLLIRQGKILEVRVKAIVERYQNETIRNDVSLKDLDCTVSKENGDDNKYSIRAVSMSLNCTFPSNAYAELEFFMFKAAGNITGEDGNEYEVKEGAVKMNIKIDGWPNNAEILDVVFGMKCGLDALKGRVPAKLKKKIKRSAGAPNRRAAQSFSVCPEARGTFAANFKDGNTDKNMPEGYPKSGDTLKESDAEITLRFSGSEITYDPVMEVGDDVAEENAEEIPNSAISFVPNFLLMIAAFVIGQLKFY